MSEVGERPRTARLRAPPTLPGVPLIGHLHRFWTDPLGLLEDAARHGDVIGLRFGMSRAALVNHPDLVRSVLLASHTRVELSPASLEGYARGFLRIAARHTESWHPGLKLDVPDQMTRLSLQIIGETLFNADVGDEATLEELVQDVSAVFRHALLPLPRIRQRSPLPSPRELQSAQARLDVTIQRIIAERRASGGDRGGLLSSLLAARDEGAVTDSEVRDEVVTFLTAGHELSASALTWTLYLLTQHPEVTSKVQDELDCALSGRPPDPSILGQLPYLRQVVSEALRVYPPAWLMTQVATEDTAVGGYRIKKGTMLMMAPWLLHRDGRFFDAPLQFRPERWAPEGHAGPPTSAYFPFGAGLQAHVGEHLALTEILLVLAVLLSRWRFALAPEARVELAPDLTLRARYGMPMVVTERGRIG